jgi:transposase
VAQANEAIAEKLEDLNDRKFQLLDTTRRALYENLDRPALKPLPPYRYEIALWSEPRVNIDYHVDVERHYYSVPYTLLHKKVDARRTATTVEIFFKNRRVASHKRSYRKGGHTTLKEHMPKAHQQYLEWTPSRILQWASKSGPATGQLAGKIMEAKRHPEQGYRACLGVLRLGKAYGNDRLEAACARALAVGTHSYKSVKSILKHGLDREPLPESNQRPEPVSIEHENIRGAKYYQ